MHNAGKQFAYIKSTEGGSLTDIDFGNNMSPTTGAKANGLLVGVYHHATPATTANDALNEANYFVNVAGSYMTAGPERDGLFGLHRVLDL